MKKEDTRGVKVSKGRKKYVQVPSGRQEINRGCVSLREPRYDYYQAGV